MVHPQCCWRSIVTELGCPLPLLYLQIRRYLSFDMRLAAFSQGNSSTLVCPAYSHTQNSLYVVDFNSTSLRAIFRRLLSIWFLYPWRKCLISDWKLPRHSALLAVSDSVVAGRAEGSIVTSRLGCRVYVTRLQSRFSSFPFRMFASGAERGISNKLEFVCRTLEELPTLSDETLDLKLRTLDIAWNPDIVALVIKRLECPKLAYNYFTWLIEKCGYKPTHVEYNALLQKLGFAKLFKYLRMVLNRMKAAECQMSPATYTILVRSYGKAGRVHDACQALLEMSASGGPSNIEAYNGLIESFMKSGRVEAARLMYKQMRQVGLIPNQFTVSILINGLCRAGKLEEAQTFLKDAPATNTICYNALLNGFCQAGKINEAYIIWDEMKVKGFKSDVYTYNTLILGSCKAGLLDVALKLREDMVEKGIPPDGFTRGTLIPFLCKAEREHEAFKMLATMMSQGCVLSSKEYHALRLTFSGTTLSSAAQALLIQMIRI